MASYSYDLLGRGTLVNYTGGGSDSWAYTRDSRVATKNLETLSYDKIGNITQWNSNGTDGAVSYSYTGTHGSKALGLPSASTGSGNIGQNAQRTVDFSYNASTGLMNELDYSDLGTYTLSHDTAGRLSSVTYPDTSQESYTYQGGLGRLSQIQYPNNQSLGFSWNSQGQVSQLQVNDNGTLSSYAFNYNTRGKLASYSKTVGGITTEQWYLFHGPQGLEKAQRLQYGMLNLTLDFTTDPRGRILSMTHTPSGGAQGFTGEVYFHYDNAGNTSLLTNASGAPLASFQHDALSGMLLNAWNPQNITFPWIGGGSAGGITIKPFSSPNRFISFDAFSIWKTMQEALKIMWNKIGKAYFSNSSENERSALLDNCIKCCDPAKKAGNIDYGSWWFGQVQGWWNEHKNDSCEELRDERDGKRVSNNSSIRSSHYWEDWYKKYKEQDWGHYQCLSPWDDKEWKRDRSRVKTDSTGCEAVRAAAGILQTSDCMLSCCNQFPG